MVTFRLIEENEQRIVYRYFPEGKEDNGYGVIIVDKVKGFFVPTLPRVVNGWANRLLLLMRQNGMPSSMKL